MSSEIRDMPNEEYHQQTDYISASMLKTFIKSRRRFHNECILGNPGDFGSALDLGTVAHAMVLEPDKMDEIAVVIPNDVLSKSGSKAGKSWQEFKAEHEGIILLKSSEMETVLRMSKNVFENESAMRLLATEGETEESVFVENDWGKFRCRMDRRIPGKFIIDLKTTRDAEPKKFEQQVRDLGYHIQAEFYRRLCDEHFGCKHTFLFIAVRNTHPFSVGVYSLSDRHLFAAGETIDRAVEAIKECKEKDDWREPWEKQPMELQPPTWWKPNEENDSDD